MNNQLNNYNWINKKNIPYILGIIIVVLVVVGLVYYFYKQQAKETEKQILSEKTIEEILKKDLTAPTTEENIEISEEKIKDLTAPKQEETKESSENIDIKEVEKDILKKLTAPQ